MKKIGLLVSMVMLSFLSFSQQMFILKGYIAEDIANYSKVSIFIKDELKRNIEYQDSTVIMDRRFMFNGVMNEPGKNASLMLRVDHKEYNAVFILDSGANYLDMRINKSKRNLEVSTGKSLSNYVRVTLDSLKDNFYHDYRAKNNITGSFSLPTEDQQLLNQNILKVIELYPHNYYSLISLYALSRNVSMVNHEEMILNTYNKLDSNLKVCVLGQKIFIKTLAHLESRHIVDIKQSVQEFQIKTAEGKVFNNKSLKGKPYIVAFSATWCAPCQESLPKLKQLYDKYKGAGLKVIYFNIDNNIPRWKAHIRKNSLTWINVSEGTKGSAIGERFHIDYIPTYILVNRDGTIIYNSNEIDPEINLMEKYIRKIM